MVFLKARLKEIKVRTRLWGLGKGLDAVFPGCHSRVISKVKREVGHCVPHAQDKGALGCLPSVGRDENELLSEWLYTRQR